MAIDPVFSPPVSPEPAPQRSRASDARDGAADFKLPERRDDPPPAPQDTSRASSGSAKAEVPSKDAKPADGQGPAKAAAASPAKTAKPADATTPTSAVPTTQGASSDKAAVPVSDIGALASILAAEQSEAGAAKVGEGSQAVEEQAAVVVKPGKKKPGEEGDAVPVPAPAAAQLPAPMPSAAALLALVAAGMPAATETAQVTQTAQAEAGAVKSGAANTGAAKAAPAAIGTGGLIIALPVGNGEIAGGKAQDATGVAAALDTTSGGHPASVAKDAAKLDPATVSVSSSAQPAAAEFKLPETLQQALAPIDLSGLVAQASGKVVVHAQAGAAIQDPATLAGQLPQAQTAATVPTPLHVVPIEIGMRALAGARSFDIRLDPAELGRVDVNLSISDKGEVSAKLVVDRVETLHLLQRDARTLERAFEQAGLKPSDSGVDISLRDNSGQAFRQQRQQDDQPSRQRRPSQPDETDAIGGVAAVANQPSRQIVRLGGVDLSI